MVVEEEDVGVENAGGEEENKTQYKTRNVGFPVSKSHSPDAPGSNLLHCRTQNQSPATQNADSPWTAP